MLVLTTSQNNSEWFSARCGMVTASRVADAKRRLERASGDRKKGDWHGDHEEYVRELMREMLTGIPAWHKVTMEMQYGSDHQDDALEAYSKHIGEPVLTVGFAVHEKLTVTGLDGKPRFCLGASPDCLTRTGGGEAKVPLLATHMDTILADEIPEKYKPQMYTNMLVWERPHWDFISWCPKDVNDDERLMLPDHLRLFVKRLYADQDKFKEIEEAATATIEEAVALVKKLSSRRLVQV